MISGSAWKGCKAGLSPVTQHSNNQDCPNDSLSACPRETVETVRCRGQPVVPIQEFRYQ